MRLTLREIAASFDQRAATYDRNDWHRRVAEALVAHCQLTTGSTVIDAGTGTGFVAVAASRALGPHGHVLAVDLSAGMLAVAQRHVPTPETAPITWRIGDATALADVSSRTIDAVLAAAVLLYMPIADALREWHRVLKPGGTVGFTAMRAGSPLAALLFRETAAAAGVHLEDASATLGSESACDVVLWEAGFRTRAVSAVVVPFSAQDVNIAWTSNLLSPAHTPVQALSARTLERMRADFEERMARAERRAPGSTTKSDVLVAIGRK